MSNDNSVQNEGIAEVDAHHIVATALPHMATIATAAADNRFDHTERLGGKVADIRGAA